MRTASARTVSAAAAALLLAASAPFAQNNFLGMGSSIVSHTPYYISAFLQVTGMAGTTAEVLVPGAPLWYIWERRDSLLSMPEDYLDTHTVDALYMCPAAAVKLESAACVNFARAGIRRSPDLRVFIQERYDVEPDTDGTLRFCFFEETCEPDETIDLLFRPDMLRIAYQVASAIGRPVYDVPVASAIEAVKDLITAGQFDGLHARMDLHNGYQPDGSIDSHLNSLGKYIMAATVWAAVYHQDPRSLPNPITGFYVPGGNDTLLAVTRHDAGLINQTVYDVVRGRPFSGWCDGEPATYREYMDSLAGALRNCETFENIDTLAGNGTPVNGSFTGQDGIVWTYHQGWGTEMSHLSINEETMLLGAVTPGDTGFLTATIPGGISQLTLQYRGRYKSPGAADIYKYRLAVIAGGDTLAVLDKILEGGTMYARRFEDVNLPPGGELKFVSTGTDFAKIDNIQWEDYNGTVGNAAPGSRHRAPSVPAVGYHRGLLTIEQGDWNRVTVVGVDGRMVVNRWLAGGSSARAWLAPGTYMVMVSGKGGPRTATLVVH